MGRGYLFFIIALVNYLKSIHNLSVPSFFFMKSTGAPQGDTLGWLYLFFNNSYNWIYNSFNLGVPILYGALEIGEAPNTKTIEKSISLFGGNPSTFGNTSTNSWSTGKYSMLGLLHVVVYSTWVAYNWKPFLKHFFSYKHEIFLIEMGLGIPFTISYFPSSLRQENALL